MSAETTKEAGGRPDAAGTLCSNCGLCRVSLWPSEHSRQSCVFRNGWLGAREAALFGRERYAEDPDESCFGICRQRLVACVKKPPAGTAWSGVITHIARKALTSGVVEAVATLHRGPEDWFSPLPVLARSEAEVLAGSGNKPVLSPVLSSLQAAVEQGVRRLLVIGAACHVHALRDFKERFDYLKDMELYVVGIPCVSNVTQKNLRAVLKMFSRSPDTVRHYEFMQDYTVHMKHENGRIEKLPYFSIPREFTGINLVAPSCMSCFDYPNSLADIMVGYMGAPLNMKKLHQWLLVRTEKGEELQKLVAPDLETVPEVTAGNCKMAVKGGARRIIDQMTPGREAQRKSGRKVPVWAGRLLAAVLSRTGPRGPEYARYAVDLHLIRNYYYVKFYYPEMLSTLVPKHVLRVLELYAFKEEEIQQQVRDSLRKAGEGEK